jgi:hypothetical protein
VLADELDALDRLLLGLDLVLVLDEEREEPMRPTKRAMLSAASTTFMSIVMP